MTAILTDEEIESRILEVTSQNTEDSPQPVEDGPHDNPQPAAPLDVVAPACATREWRYIRPFAEAVDGLIDTLANPDGRLLFGLRDVDVMMRGVGQGELCFVTGRSHSGKCVTHDTLFTLADGTRRRANDLEVGNGIVGASGPVRVEAIEDNGVHPIIQIETHCGRALRVTENHPVLVDGEWVVAADLKEGDTLTIPLGWDGYTLGTMSTADAFFLGLFVGDGSWSKENHEPRFTTVDVELLEFVEKWMAGIGGSVADRRRGGRVDYALSGRTFKPKLRSLGYAPSTAHYKHAPDLVMQGTSEIWLAFLSGLMDTDGTVTRGTLAWHSVSRQLMSDCQELFRRLGFHAKLVVKNGTYHGQPHKSWRLSLCLRDGSAEVARRLTCLGPKRGRMASLTHARPSGNHQKLPTVVRSVTACAAEETLAVQVSGDHTHLTEGIVTHNTQLVMQAIANHPNKRWLMFTPDEVSELVLMKLACITHGYSAEDIEARLQRGDPQIADMLRDTATTFFPNLIVIDEGLDFGRMQIALEEAEQFWGGPADGIIIDYLELIPGGDSGNDGVTWKVQELKRWTKTVHRPVICLHQGRRGDRGKSKGIDGMRYGGENEATFVVEVYRKCQDDTLDEYERQAEAHTITVALVKNKRPPCKTGACDLYIHPDFGSIRPLQEGDRYVTGTQPASPTEALAVVRQAQGTALALDTMEDF